MDNAITALRAALDAPEPEPVAWAREYKAIQEFYATRTADRSRLPLMRHIDDGLHILTLNEASDLAKAAFCLHPIVQNDEAVDVSWSSAYQLACEYRDKANAYLCRPNTDWISSAEDVRSVVGEMSEDCRAMLIADKRQNYGDFIAAHYGKHARSEELDRYFRVWIDFLERYTRPQPTRKQSLPVEPVAWMHNMVEDVVVTHRPAILDRHPERWTALYPVPREWVGLTEEEIVACKRTEKRYLSSQEFARAIEAKLKEKNT